MKSFKIISLAMMLLVALTGCGEKSGSKATNVAGEWQLVQRNEATPEFNVYIDFNSDGTFEMYQQVWSFDYELYTGKYVITGDVMTGTYADGTNWACGYRINVVDGQLYMYSQEDHSVTSVYNTCTIPTEIKAEASATRAMEVVPFL